jgi:addiction module HigA family antidote
MGKLGSDQGRTPPAGHELKNKGLGVSRKTLSALLNGRSGISPEMAIRLSKAFGGSAESCKNVLAAEWLIQN